MAIDRAVSALMLLTVMCEGLEIPDELFMRMPELVSRATDGQFFVVEYMAHTADGYMLGVHRLRSREWREITLPPVLIMHGLLGSSEDYVRMGQNRSLPILLAETGYDVWVGNLRGNTYTHHIKLSKRNPEFWNFSIDEHGTSDVPAIMDLIFSETKAQRIHYIGYSMGCTSFMMACNARPDLASKIISFTGLAPAMGIAESLKPLTTIILKSNLPKYLHNAGYQQLGIDAYLLKLIASTICAPKVAEKNICYKISFTIAGRNYPQIDWEKSKIIFGRFQPTSLRVMMHWSQILLTGKISKYDWGKENIEMYGHAQTDPYVDSAIVAPTNLFYGINDTLITPLVVNKFANRLMKTNPTVKLYPMVNFNHLDFVFAKDIQDLLNKNILNVINNYSNDEI